MDGLTGTSPYDRMLGSLRTTLGQRIPGGLTEPADKRLQRTLDHYIKEVLRIQGVMNEREILRETFDSMAGWFRRNTDALATTGAAPPAGASPLPPPPPVMHAVSTDPPLAGVEEEDPLVLFERLKAARSGATPTLSLPLVQQPPQPQPQPRGIPELTAMETRAKPPVVGVPASFMSTPLDVLNGSAVQPKDFVQRQENVVKYREAEYNLILNSKDRNWLLNTTENRYNFTVQLNGGATPQGRGYQATLMQRLKNIVRIEFIKAILPVEGLEVVVPRACDPSGTTPTPEAGFVSALSLPFVQVMLDEQQGNNLGTTDTIDRSLAICQYDATWKSDQTHDPTHNRGYTLFFPKFMKAQRVFAPTPLASLQNLHFQLLNPEGLPVSCAPDSLAVRQILFSSAVDVSGTCYYDRAADGNANYLFLQTSDYFPLWTFSMFDRVTCTGLQALPAPAVNQTAFGELAGWLGRPAGHIVVGIANGAVDGTPGGITMGANTSGYANWIVLRNRFTENTTTGSSSRDYFAGSSAAEDTFATQLANTSTGRLTAGGVLNLSRQVQLFLRVITREVDSGTNVRPDNV
jgi:hypothetical protein